MKPLYPQAEDHMDVISELLDVPCVVTERVEGNPFEVAIERTGKDDNPYNVVLDKAEGVTYDRLDKTRLQFFLHDMMYRAATETNEIRLFGIYVPETDEIFFYDLAVDGEDIGARYVYSVFQAYAIQTVPVLSVPGQTLGQWLGRRPLNHPSQSRLRYAPRLGILIRPEVAMEHPDIGNVVLSA